MKTLTFVSVFLLVLGILSCGSEPKEPVMTETEQTAVEEQIKQDQIAMDSLEKAILSQMADTVQ